MDARTKLGQSFIRLLRPNTKASDHQGITLLLSRKLVLLELMRHHGLACDDEADKALVIFACEDGQMIYRYVDRPTA